MTTNKSLKMRNEKRKQTLLFIAVFTVLTIWSMWETKFNPISIIASMGETIKYVVFDFFPPDISSIPHLLQPTLDTLYMSFVAMVIAALISFILAFLASSTTTPHYLLQVVTRAIASILRTVPSLVWVILLVSSFGLGAMSGTMALILGGVGILTRTYAEVLDEIDMDQLAAIKATGANWFQVMGRAVLPQFLPGFVGWSLFKFDINIRDSAVIGMVGGGGLGFAIQEGIKLFQFQTVTMAIFMVLVLIVIIEYITSNIRERIL